MDQEGIVQDRLSTGQQKIAGYRNLSEEEVSLINSIKATEREVMRLIGIVRLMPDRADGERQRWASIGRTDLQKGFMALVRAVALPQ